MINTRSSNQARGYLIVELRMLQKSLSVNHLLEIFLVYNLAIFSEGRNEAYSESFLKHYSIKILKLTKNLVLFPSKLCKNLYFQDQMNYFSFNFPDLPE